MKKVIFICFLGATVFLACEDNRETSHEIQWSSDKKDSIVYVNYRQQDGSFSNFYMNYVLYSMLFKQGGYGSVYNYYQQHPTEFNTQSRYSNYKPYSSPSKSYLSPIRHFGSPSSPSRNYSSPIRSYSSPSRRR